MQRNNRRRRRGPAAGKRGPMQPNTAHARAGARRGPCPPGTSCFRPFSAASECEHARPTKLGPHSLALASPQPLPFPCRRPPAGTLVGSKTGGGGQGQAAAAAHPQVTRCSPHPHRYATTCMFIIWLLRPPAVLKALRLAQPRAQPPGGDVGPSRRRAAQPGARLVSLIRRHPRAPARSLRAGTPAPTRAARARLPRSTRAQRAARRPRGARPARAARPK